MLILALLLLYLVTRPGSSAAREYYAALPFLLTYTTNWVELHANNLAITWSLATEEQFYLGWPLIEKFLRPIGVAAVLAGVILVNQLINYGVLDGLFAALYGRPISLPILADDFHADRAGSPAGPSPARARRPSPLVPPPGPALVLRGHRRPPARPGRALAARHLGDRKAARSSSR